MRRHISKRREQHSIESEKKTGMAKKRVETTQSEHSNDTSSSWAGQTIFQLRVVLLGTKPPIWRRLLVPADLTLAQLHKVLQVAMGWRNEHLHEFHAGQYRIPNERAKPISAAFPEKGSKVIYTYDFGNCWEHRITLEKLFPAEPHHVSGLHRRPSGMSAGRLRRRSGLLQSPRSSRRSGSFRARRTELLDRQVQCGVLLR